MVGEKGIPPRGRVCSLKECKTGFWKERSCGHRNLNFNVLIGNFVKKSNDF